MTKDQIEEYKKTSKIGDRFVYSKEGLSSHPTIYFVIGVEDRGPLFSIREKTPDHMCLMDWNWLDSYSLIHKQA
jgi:hypothetical protein